MYIGEPGKLAVRFRLTETAYASTFMLLVKPRAFISKLPGKLIDQREREREKREMVSQKALA